MSFKGRKALALGCGRLLSLAAALPLLLVSCSRGRPTAALPEVQSTRLKSTAIVPTLGSPLCPGKSALWCASFQLAWKRLESDVIKEEPRIQGAEELSERLNEAPQSEADLPDGSCYAAAGLVKDGIIERIEKELAQRFPMAPRPQFDTADPALVAYAWLEAEVKFTAAFLENDEPLGFKDASGQQTRVRSFGILPEHQDDYLKLREQVVVLFSGSESGDPAEFAIDPCKTSVPSQLVLARVALKASLLETVAYVEEEILESSKFT